MTQTDVISVFDYVLEGRTLSREHWQPTVNSTQLKSQTMVEALNGRQVGIFVRFTVGFGKDDRPLAVEMPTMGFISSGSGDGEAGIGGVSEVLAISLPEVRDTKEVSIELARHFLFRKRPFNNLAFVRNSYLRFSPTSSPYNNRRGSRYARSE